MKINAPEVNWNEKTAAEERYIRARANSALVRRFRPKQPQQSWLRRKWEEFLDHNFR